MADLQTQAPEALPEANPARGLEREKTPESLVNKIKEKVQDIEMFQKKLDDADQRVATSEQAAQAPKAPKEKKPKELTVNWHYMVAAYNHVSYLAKRNMFKAVEYIREVRKNVYQHSDKTLRRKIQHTLTAMYLFFTL